MRPTRSALPLLPLRPARWWRPVRGLLAAVAGALALLLAVSAPPAAAGTSGAGAERAAAPLPLYGGDMLYSRSGRCLLSFNAYRGRAQHGIIPADCGPVGTQWYRDSALTTPVGATSHTSRVYAVISYGDGVDARPAVRQGTRIIGLTGMRTPVLGQSICHTSVVSGLTCGTVTGLNQTVVFPGGVITGLIRATTCAHPIDMGAPALVGSQAVGFLLGGSGNCPTGGTSFYQPLAPVLATFGLTLLPG
ncbi:S1 family peptidase [Streptomyces sp. TRM 70351]|uniref:S1 family peptidase n=1 Tax=Streptomyces sp. TRM 70351 TaxID=3116552 RepID=UPI002E7B2EEB|nr:S1 family peptidase [Streptomyces sp. TRM 70351]MEE1930774.1 S1 family peptidase [Streptomyces sp. TRM 70351]